MWYWQHAVSGKLQGLCVRDEGEKGKLVLSIVREKFPTLWTSERESGTHGVEFRDSALKTSGVTEKSWWLWRTWVLTYDLQNLFHFSKPLHPPFENEWFGFNFGQNLFQLRHSQLLSLSWGVQYLNSFSFFCFPLLPIFLGSRPGQVLTELGYGRETLWHSEMKKLQFLAKECPGLF